MKHEICPECGTPWNENEIEFQLCNTCRYENKNEAMKIQIKGIGKSFLKWFIVILVTSIIVSVYQVTAFEPNAGMTLFIFIVSSAITILIINQTRLNK